MRSAWTARHRGVLDSHPVCREQYRIAAVLTTARPIDVMLPDHAGGGYLIDPFPLRGPVRALLRRGSSLP